MSYGRRVPSERASPLTDYLHKTVSQLVSVHVVFVLLFNKRIGNMLYRFKFETFSRPKLFPSFVRFDNTRVDDAFGLSLDGRYFILETNCER